MTPPTAPSTEPLAPSELRALAREMAESLVEHECNFSHPDWRYVAGLNALADSLDDRSDRDDAERLDLLERLADECELLRRALRRTNALVSTWSVPQLLERYGKDAPVLIRLSDAAAARLASSGEGR